MCYPAILAENKSLFTLIDINMVKNIQKMYLFLSIVSSFGMEATLGGWKDGSWKVHVLLEK